MQKIYNILVFLFIVVIIIMPFQTRGQMDSNFSKFSARAGYGDTAAEASLATIIANIIKWFLTILGVIFVIITIYSGYLWLTAGGNEDQVGLAKKKMINAIIGLFLCLAAYAITYMVLEGVIEAVQGRF